MEDTKLNSNIEYVLQIKYSNTVYNETVCSKCIHDNLHFLKTANIHHVRFILSIKRGHSYLADSTSLLADTIKTKLLSLYDMAIY